MQKFYEDDCEIIMEPIKKKPKLQELVKTKIPILIEKVLKPNPPKPTFPIKHLPDLKAHVSLLESLKITEKIQADTMQSSLKSDYTEWKHKDFIFPLNLTQTPVDPDYTERLGQYFKDFNQKCQIYPYKHFVDLTPDQDHFVSTAPPVRPPEDDVILNAPTIIPLKEMIKVEMSNKRSIKILIKMEPK